MSESISIPISETFASIQGEGMLAGTPSWFCRVSGCNLRCSWCDTPYASWSPEGDSRTIEELVSEARASALRHAVLTGGEPMLFPQVRDLTHRLRASGMHVTIETAGTVDQDLTCDLISVSPKLANSTPTDDPRDPTGVWQERHEARRFQPDVLRSVLRRGEQRQVKFVVCSPADLDEIDTIVRTIGCDPDEVMLMPEGVAPKARDEVQWIVRACMERGWRYCPRLHIDLFGNRRGT